MVIIRSILILLLLRQCCLGQSPQAITRDGGTYELSGTYTHVLTDGTFGRPLSMNGWTAAASAKLLPIVQVAGEVGQYRKPGASIYSFLGGPQAKVRIWRLQPFIRGLFGVSRFSGSNVASVAAGGGIDLPLTDHISLRALQCDYYRFLGGKFGKTDLLRAGIGLTYSFAK